MEPDYEKYDAPVITAELAKPGALIDAKAHKALTGAERGRAAAQDTENAKVSHAKGRLITRAVFEKIVDTYGDPLEELAKIGFAKRPNTDTGELEYEHPVDIRLNALKELVSYGHSKLKTIEHTGADGAPLEFKMSLVQNILNMVNNTDDNAGQTNTIIGN